MAIERVSHPRGLPRLALMAAYAREVSLAGWHEPWWKPSIGIPLYVLATALFAGGLLAGLTIAALQGAELLLLALVAADAWGLRRRLPLLGSRRKSRAAAGWLLLVATAAVLALALPGV